MIPEFDMSDEKIIDTNQIAAELRQTDLPIFIWGYALTARCVNERLTNLGVKISGFATDRQDMNTDGVIQKSELIEKYPAYILVKGFERLFAMSDDEILADWRGCQKVYTVGDCYDVIITEEMSREFYLEYKAKFDEVYDNLADDFSRDSLRAYLMTKILHNPSAIVPYVISPQYFFTPTIWKTSDKDVLLDGGAFDGDSAMDFVNFSGGKYGGIIACEPDPTNFKVLQENLSARGVQNFIALNVGLGEETGTLKFSVDNGVMSTFANDEGIEIPIDTIDNISAQNGGGYDISIIKLDVEKFEMPTLRGARKTISENRPILAISAYHRRGDIFQIYQYVNSVAPNYRFYFRCHKFNAIDAILYAIPKERSI